MLRKVYRATIWVVLITFGFQALGGNVWASVVKSNRSSVIGDRKEKTAAEEWGEVISSLGEEVRGKRLEVRSLEKKGKEIEGVDKKLRKEFKETEKFLKEKNLPDKILQRHYEFVKQYEENYSKLKENLTKAITTKNTKELKDFIEKAQYKKKPRPLDPNKLPHRLAPRLEPKEPKTKKGISLQQSAISSLPTDADLKPTIDVQITDEIRKLANETLKGNPVLIYEYIRNNFDYEPYYGSLKGSQQTLWEKAGNDFDLASILIALYRAANIPARYVYGTIEIPINKAMNWVGVKDPYTCANVFASGGIPSKAITSGGKIVALQMERCWVEVYIAYMPDEGVTSRGQKIWIPVDPSFKQYKDKSSVNLASAIGFDAQSFYDEVKAQSTTNPDGSVVMNEEFIRQKLEENQTKLSDYLDTNLPGTPTLFDVLGYRTIIKEEFGLLLGSLPYKTISVLDRYSEASDSLRHKVSFNISGTSYTASLVELASKRITIYYIGATDADRSLLANYENIEDVPAYLVEMKPVLMINGTPVVEGPAIGLGADQVFTMAFTSPNGPSEQIINYITAGGYYAVGIDLQNIPRELITKLQTNLQTVIDMINQGEGLLLPDDLLGELLWGIAQTYWCELDATNKVIAKMLGISSIRYPSEAMVFVNLSTSYLFGIPESVEVRGLSIDVDRDIESPFAVDGDLTKRTTYMIQSGMNGSILEHSIFEQMLGIKSVSAIKIMQIANSQNIPTYQITSENISQVLPLLQVPSDVKSDIQDYINAGMVVTTPKNEITYNSWTGTGYIVLDPDTGAGVYMISGGLGGGETTDDGWWNRIRDAFSGLLAIASILQSGEGVEIAKILKPLKLIGIFLPLALTMYNAIIQVDNTNLSPDTKIMLMGFIVTFGVIGMGASLIGFLGPMGIAVGYVVSIYVSFVLENILPMLIYFAEYYARIDELP
ncbi:MAG: transglutaminase domain-containing protein [bacterium]|nr:transglutaminase domain-containing protein [bacterium]